MIMSQELAELKRLLKSHVDTVRLAATLHEAEALLMSLGWGGGDLAFDLAKVAREVDRMVHAIRENA